MLTKSLYFVLKYLQKYLHANKNVSIFASSK
nr:MAG TPA: hypothetical protein [Caudoviricetes sp.]